jgi:hypothetical protein
MIFNEVIRVRYCRDRFKNFAWFTSTSIPLPGCGKKEKVRGEEGVGAGT